MDGLLNLFSREQGQARRAALQGLLEQFIPPTARAPLNLLADMNPVAGMERAGVNAQRVANPDLGGWDRFRAGADMATDIASVVAPAWAVSRAGGPAIAAATEGLLGVGTPGRQAAEDMGRRFVADESGAIRAFHGSPYDFDRFSMDKIGTGEGAQAYGHGLYFADSEDVARQYRDALKFPRIDGAATPIEQVADDLNYHRGNVDGVRSAYERMANSADPKAQAMGREKLEALPAALERFKGRMYEVSIDANPEDFLDWDAPLSAQPRILEQFGYNDAKYPEDWIPDTNITGAQLYRQYAGSTNDGVRGNASGAVSNSLSGGAPRPIRMKDGSIKDLPLKIPGIRYLDAGSRGMDGAGGTRNYVVFDENLINIVRKYGIAGAAAMLGLSQAEVSQAMEQQPQRGLLEAN